MDAMASPSGLKPRALEGELTNAVGNKRRASTEANAEERPTFLGGIEAVSDGTNKRQRSALQPRMPEDVDTEPISKPDVFEYFAQRANKHKELQQEVERLKSRESLLDRRAQDAEIQSSRLRAELTAAAARHEGREAQLQLKCNQMETAWKRELERAAVLEVQARQASRASAGLAVTTEHATTITPLSDQSNDSMREAYHQLKLKVTELELSLSAVTAEAEGASRRLEAELESEKQRRLGEAATIEALQRRVEEAEAHADAVAAAHRQAESRAAELEAEILQIQGAAAARSSNEVDAVLIKSLREQLKNAEATAAEVVKLRQQAASAAALREKLEAAENRARCAEQSLQDDAQVHAELATTQAELSRWTAILSGMADCSTPEDVVYMVKHLQSAQLVTAASLGDRAEELAAIKVELETATTEAKLSSARAEAAISRAEAAEMNLVRIEKKVDLLTKERESLKSLLASYDEEYLTKEGDQGGQISPQMRRIAELEATVEALHNHIKSLETDLGAGSAAAAGGATSVAESEAKLIAADSRVKVLETEVQNLVKEIAMLQERVGRGEFNAETTKVVHFKNNPEAELQRAAKESRIAELESENEALKQNVQRLEAVQGGDSATATSTASVSLRVAQLEGEVNLLRRRLAEAQKASDRLQQVFTQQISTFRNAIKGLFGYAVEMTSDPTAKDFKAEFKLKPQYCDEAGAELAFRMLRDGRVAFVKTDFSTRRLTREVETFVERYRSIPAFTANLTMENFQKHTQG